MKTLNKLMLASLVAIQAISAVQISKEEFTAARNADAQPKINLVLEIIKKMKETTEQAEQLKLNNRPEYEATNQSCSRLERDPHCADVYLITAEKDNSALDSLISRKQNSRWSRLKKHFFHFHHNIFFAYYSRNWHTITKPFTKTRKVWYNIKQLLSTA